MKSRILIKIGGRAFEDEQGFRELAEAILTDPEVEVIIVHGGGTEISHGSYARQAVYDSADTHTVKWAAAAATGTAYGVKNSATITYPTATGNWGDVKAVGIFSHLTTGNFICFSPLAATKTVNSGDTFKFTSNNLTVTLS